MQTPGPWHQAHACVCILVEYWKPECHELRTDLHCPQMYLEHLFYVLLCIFSIGILMYLCPAMQDTIRASTFMFSYALGESPHLNRQVTANQFSSLYHKQRTLCPSHLLSIWLLDHQMKLLRYDIVVIFGNNCNVMYI